MNHRILYAALLIAVENNQFFSIASLAQYLNCSHRQIIENLDILSDMGAINWSLGLDNILQIELLADLTIG